eukprot:22707-Chlamydomonas_euryale.AAC.13
MECVNLFAVECRDWLKDRSTMTFGFASLLRCAKVGGMQGGFPFKCDDLASFFGFCFASSKHTDLSESRSELQGARQVKNIHTWYGLCNSGPDSQVQKGASGGDWSQRSREWTQLGCARQQALGGQAAVCVQTQSEPRRAQASTCHKLRGVCSAGRTRSLSPLQADGISLIEH